MTLQASRGQLVTRFLTGAIRTATVRERRAGMTVRASRGQLVARFLTGAVRIDSRAVGVTHLASIGGTYR